MTSATILSSLLIVGILWGCVLGIQRPPPRYSQQLMPDTSFTCRQKIIGSYYADPETDCQLFHVCVSVAGSIQDYRFLCPNDTAFDQESQTCADWYDVDCEAATLYYASDNFDLYRLGSGLESVHYDNIRTDAEPLDNLQRSESSDAVRSSANNPNKALANSNDNNNNNNNNRDILRGSSSGNFYNSRNNVNGDDYDAEKVYRDESASKKPVGVRKIARKQKYNGNNANSVTSAPTSSPFATSTTTSSPAYERNRNDYQNNGNYQNENKYDQRTSNYNEQRSTAIGQRNDYSQNQKRNDYEQRRENFFNNNDQRNENGNRRNEATSQRTDYAQKQDNYDQRRENYQQRPTTNYFVPTTSTVRSTVARDNAFGRNDNQKYNSPTTYSTTYRPTTKTYQENAFNDQRNNFNSNKFNDRINFPTSNGQTRGTTSRTTEYNDKNDRQNANPSQTSEAYPKQFDQYATPSTTLGTTTGFQSTDYGNYQQKNYKNFERSSSSALPASLSTTTPSASTFFDYNGARGGLPTSEAAKPTTLRQDFAQTTTKYVSNNFAGSSYIPTTYSPVTKKFANNENVRATTRGNDQYDRYNRFDQYDVPRTTNDGQYRERTSTPQTAQTYDNGRNYEDNSGQYRDQRITKAPKKANNNFDNFDRSKTPSITGFSPSSINKLAESPVPATRATTPLPRRTPNASPSTQRSSLGVNGGVESQTTPNSRTAGFSSVTPRPFSSTARSVDRSFTTPKAKTAKKNDYDYAYYDNTGPLEYDGLDFEQVAGARDSAKIIRN